MSYQWCYHPAMQVPLHSARSKWKPHIRMSHKKQEIMASEQSMTQAITPAAIEAAKAAIMTFREAQTQIDDARLIQTAPRMGTPTLKQPMFNWKIQDKYHV